MRLRIFYLVSNLLLVTLSFLLVIALRGQEPFVVFQQRLQGFLMLLALYVLTGMLFDKYNFRRHTGLRKTVLPILYANLAFAGAASALLIMLGHLGVSRVLLFGTLTTATVIEALYAALVDSFRKLKQKEFTYEKNNNGAMPAVNEPEPQTTKKDPESFMMSVHGMVLRKSIVDEVGIEALDYLKKHVDFSEHSIVLAVNNPLNIVNLPPHVDTIINLHRVNDHRRVNRFFETVNLKLPQNGIYVGCGETQEVRKKRFLKKYTPVAGFVLYVLDFLIHRVMPKLNLTQTLYFKITRGKNRVMSRAEILGRLYSCGFAIVSEFCVNGLFFFVAKKIKRSSYDNSPTYGPLVRLRRIGKDKKVIGVYKLRTMHPYSEYIQAYVYSLHGTCDGDKITNDFRITTWGRIFRKLWIDELPMLYNWLRGDLKLVGVRPLSEHKFNTYPEYLQEKRVLTRPGLVPPFYADMPQTEEAFYESENRYIDAYLKRPFRTDWQYFWKAFRNIVFRGARSS